MAATAGKDGSVRIGTVQITFMDTWSVTPSVDTPEVTQFGNTSKAFESALRAWNVTLSGTLDRSDTGQADVMDQFENGTLADLALRFYTAAASFWSGNVRMTGQTVNSQVGDKVSLSWTGVGNGDLSFTSS